MRRADRLFEIIQLLRRAKRPLTADDIAATLETSKRTIYRDIGALMSQRVPIRAIRLASDVVVLTGTYALLNTQTRCCS